MTTLTVKNGGKHAWGDPIPIHGIATPHGCDQTERTCKLCHLVKITVHQPDGRAYREWRHPNNPDQFPMDTTPPCLAPEEKK
jgi:hypothetical protein